MTVTRARVHEFLKQCPFGIVSTVCENGAPEAAFVNLAVTDDLELIFETIQTTRKCINLRRDPRIAVVAWLNDETLQYEGVADEPDEFALRPLLEVYLAARPAALAHRGWPGLTYFRVRPRWVRFSRYADAWEVSELNIGPR